MTGKLLLAILLLCAASFFMLNTEKTESSNAAVQFKQWQSTHNKNYENSAVAEYRFAVFQQNLEIIAAQNSQNDGAEYGVNQFSDMTNEEFVFTFLGYKSRGKALETAEFDVSSVPNDVDWRQKGAVTPVKDQGKCGSCWAFSTTGDLEGLWAIQKQALVPMSEQQLMDCSYRYGNMGCNGGLMQNAFDYVKDHGICSEEAVPYKAKVGKCSACPVLFKVSGYKNVAQKDDALKAAITIQPTSIAVDASNWQNYKTGVFKNCDVNLNHGVLAVGYSADAWIVKNSWSAAWGEQGYIRLALGNTCGLLTEASYAQL